MSLTNFNRHADFEITYKDQDGKKYVHKGKAAVEVTHEENYRDVHIEGYLDPVSFYRDSRSTTITLTQIQPPEEKPVEKVETTRKIKVNDFTFQSVSDARKRAGAPKNATFECTTASNGTYALSEHKVVVFTWTEEL